MRNAPTEIAKASVTNDYTDKERAEIRGLNEKAREE